MTDQFKSTISILLNRPITHDVIGQFPICMRMRAFSVQTEMV